MAIANEQPLFSGFEKRALDAAPITDVDLVEAGAATQSQFGRGLRSGFRSLGATGNEFLGTTADAMGLSEFADERLAEADHYAQLSEAGGPSVRDYRAVKNFSDAANFVAGAAGTGVATTVPALALGAAGALKYGLRAAGPAAFAGAFVPEAGEQSMQLRHDPDLQDMTAEERLANSAVKGAGTAALESIVPGGLIKRVATGGASRTAKGVLSDIAEGAVKEGATEVAQSAIGQGMHQLADPTEALDTDELINAGLQGAAGGGVLTGGTRLLESLTPSVRSAIDTELRMPSVDGFRKRMREPVDLLDPEALPQGLDGVDDLDQIVTRLKEHDDAVAKQFDDALGGDPELASRFENFRDDPQARSDLFQELKRRRSEARYADDVNGLIDEMQAGQKADDGVKRNRQRTQRDFDIIDIVQEELPSDAREGMSSQRVVDLAIALKDWAGGNLADKKVSPHLARLFGSDGSIRVVNRVREALGLEPDEAPLRAHFEARRRERSSIDQLVMDNLRPELIPDRNVRGEALRVVSDRLMDYIDRGAKDEQAFVEDLYTAFGQNAETVIDALDRRRQRVTQDAWQTPEKPGQSLVDDGPQDTADEVVDSPLIAVVGSERSAKPILESLRKEHGAKARFITRATEDGRVEILAAPPATDETGFNDAEWESIREDKKHNASGLENGILSIRNPLGHANKINLVRLTSEMMRRQPQDQSGATTLKYVADMFSRGMSQLMSDPRFKDFKTELKRTPPKVVGNAPNFKLAGLEFTFPKNTPVAVVDGETFTYGDVLQSSMSQTKTAIKLRQNIREARTPAERKDQWRKLRDYFDAQQGDRIFAEQLEEGILEMDTAERMQNEGLPQLEDALAAALQEDLAVGERANKRLAGYLRRSIANVEREIERRNMNLAQYGTETPETDGYISDESTLDAEEMGRILERGNQAVQALKGPKKVGPKARQAQKELDERTRGGSVMRKQDARGVRTVDEDTGIGLGSTTKEAVGKTTPTTRFKRSLQQRRGEPLTEETKAEIREYFKRVLGKDAQALFKELDAAGTWAKIDGVDVATIAIDAIDPHSVGYHESMHGLIARLMAANPKAAAELMAAASSPSMKARLRKLLADEPAALKQLEDPEEALAYMYQFWANGQLKVGPKARTWFEQIAEFFKRVFRAFTEKGNMNAERIDAIFAAFEEGRFANRNTVAEVMEDVAPQTRIEKLSDLAGPLARFAGKALRTGDGYIRAMNIPPLTKVADLFFAGMDSEVKEPGFLQAKAFETNTRMNELAAAFKGVSKEDQRLAIEELQARKAESPLALKMRKMLDELFDYMVERGVKGLNDKGEYVPLNRIENYFARVYNGEAILKDTSGFIQLLTKYGVPEKLAPEIAMKLVRPAEVTDPREDDFHAGITYFMPNTKQRKLVNIPDEELAPYLNKDLFETMATYITRAVRRAEYAKRFGNKGEVIEQAVDEARKLGMTRQQQIDFRQYVQAAEGSLGHEIPDGMRKTFGAIVTYQNVRLLPLAIFTNLVDPIGIAVRGGGVGEAFKAFKRGVTSVFRKDPDAAELFAAQLGTVEVGTAINMLSDAYGSQYLTGTQRKINDWFFRWNGMEGWNRAMRVQATSAAQAFIIRHATRPNEHSERYLQELGLTKADVDIVNDELVLTDKTRNAINLWVDGAILRPNAAIRPIWMSDPHWMLVSHLKQFTYAFQKTIIARVVHEAENGNYRALMALGSYVPFIIAADVLKVALTPGGGDDEARKGWGAADYLWNGAQRAGLFGPGQYALDSYGDLGRGKLGIEGLAGPTIEQMLNLGHAAATPQGDMGKWFEKAIPGHQLVR